MNQISVKQMIKSVPAIMKPKNIFALILVVLAPCLAAVAQQAITPPAPTPSAPAPATTAPSSSAPGDTIVRMQEPSVVAHGTGTEPSTTEVVALTNELGDEILDTVTFDGIPLPDAVRALALQAGLNIQFDPRLLNTVGPDGRSMPVTPPTITEKWKKVTAKQALTSLLDNWGWQLVMDPRSPIGRITAKDPTALEPLVTTVIQLEYSSPTNILAEVQPTLSSRSSIISDPRTHKLIIRTTDRELPGVEALIAKLDAATRQVLIEAKIVETTKDITSAKGVDWTGTLAAQHVSFGNGLTSGVIGATNTSFTAPVTTGTTTLPGGTTIPTTSGGGLMSATTNVSSLTTLIPGSPSSGGGISVNTAHGFTPSTAFLSADGVSAVLSFLNTDADTRSMSFPRTVALDGVQTEIMSVQNIPIFEQTQSAPAAGAVAGLATVLPNYDKKVEGTVLNEVGVKLTVIPRIAGPTNILMDVRPEISSVDASVASYTLDGQVSTSPIFDRRRVTTQAAVPSGYTLVLGGVEIDNTLNSATKVPVFGDIPGLGSLFRSNSKTHNKDMILIFVTPTIIDESDFQPAHSQFLKKRDAPPAAEEGAWYSAKPYDWTKPATTVAPSYQP
ncbi:MAG: type II secretion system protein GspD [Limisphaerales bacterium]